MSTATKQKLKPLVTCPYEDDVIRRFLSFVDTDLVSEDECLLWRGAPCVEGYGRLGIKKSVMFSHRVSYEIYNGRLGDLCALHTCDVRLCVNPLHIYAGTRLDNARDREERGRGNQVHGEDHSVATLFDFQVLEIMDLYYQERWVLTELAKRFNVGVSSIQRYVMGEIRPDVTKAYLCELTVDELSIRGHKLKDSEVLEIFRLRHEVHMSVADIAIMFSVSKSQVRRYLCGETKPYIFDSYMKQCNER